jgi:hypothetical protein
MKNDKDEAKHITDMDYSEYSRWAKEYMVGEFLDKGLKGISDSLYHVLWGAKENKIWGGRNNNKN